MNNKITDEFKKLIIYYKQLSTNNKKLIYKINIFKNFITFINNLDFEIKNASDLNQFIDKKIGIGKGIISRVDEIIKYGYIKELKINKVDDNNILIQKLEEIYGIGEVNAKDIIKKYKIKDVDTFKELVDNGKIKINENIKKGVYYSDKIKTNISRENIKNIKTNIINSLKVFDNIKFKICGSFRRKLKYSNDIDLLIVSKDNSVSLFDYINILKKDNIIYDDLTIENIHTKYSGITKYLNELYRIDIILLPYESYYSGLLYFTGSKEFNIKIRSEAKKLGYKLNEYGLYKNNKQMLIKSEKDIFKYLNIPYLKPKLRI